MDFTIAVDYSRTRSTLASHAQGPLNIPTAAALCANEPVGLPRGRHSDLSSRLGVTGAQTDKLAARYAFPAKELVLDNQPEDFEPIDHALAETG